MTDPERLQQVLKDAKREIEAWPDWMKKQEPALQSQDTNDDSDTDQDVKLSA